MSLLKRVERRVERCDLNSKLACERASYIVRTLDTDTLEARILAGVFAAGFLRGTLDVFLAGALGALALL